MVVRMEPTVVIERYLALIADPVADPAAIQELLDPEVRFIERPNLFSPRGSERDRAQMLASLAQGRELLREQRFDVLDHLVAGDTVATRVVWTGTLAVEAPPFAAGSRLRADSSMYFTFRDGLIVRQENYDCFHLQESGGRSEGGAHGTNAGAEGS
jgi:ketosteroid isomerase-like protein